MKVFLGADLRRGQVRQALAALLQAAPVGHVDTLIVSTLGNEAVDAPDEGKTGREAFPDGFLDAFLPVYEVWLSRNLGRRRRRAAADARRWLEARTGGGGHLRRCRRWRSCTPRARCAG